MTIETTRRLKKHIGNGSATAFDYDFLIPDDDSLIVYLFSTLTLLRTALNTSQFDVTGIGNENGGTVTYPLTGDPLTADYYLIIVRDVSYTQLLNIENQGGFFADTLEAELDREVMQTQQVYERTTRMPLLLEGDTFTKPIGAKALVAGRVLAFDSDGEPTYGPRVVDLSPAVPANYQVVTPQMFDINAGNDVVDALPAFNLAAAQLGEWGTLVIPPGEYRLSSKFVWQNKYRSKIICQGVLKPRAGFSDDYLMEISNNDSDGIIPSMAQQTTIQSLKLDTEWIARGLKLDGAYDSTFYDLEIWRPRGHGIYAPRIQEVTMIKPVIFGGKPYENTSITGVATAWSSGSTYSADNYVYRDYAAYNSGTTYAAKARVRSAGFLYRSLLGSNLNHTPASSPLSWERMPEYYYRATVGHTNKDPHDGSTDYTTRAPDTLDDFTLDHRFWEPVYPHESAFELVTDDNDATIDNLKVFNFISRSNAQEAIIRLDQKFSGLPPSKLEFLFTQAHSITDQYITAFNSDTDYTDAYGGSVSQPTRHILWHIASSVGLKIIGGQTRPGNTDYCKGFLFGTPGVSGTASRTWLTSHLIDGTTSSGNNQIGISIDDSVNLTAGQWFETDLSVIMSGTGSVDKVDLGGETELVQSGTVLMLTGDTSRTFSFSPPFNGTPNIRVRAASALRGLGFEVTGVDSTGFTLTMTGRYTRDTTTASFTSAGGVNQASTDNHAFGVAHTGLAVSPPIGDVGAGFYLKEVTVDANNARLTAPAAPGADCTIRWAPFWENKTPVQLTFAYDASMEPE